MRAPTGTQYELSATTAAGPARAIITQVAAGIRRYTLGGVDVVEPFDAATTPPSGCGIALVPWPNRVKDGTWTYTAEDGTPAEQHLALTEPARRNAIHGLLRHTPYVLVEYTESAVSQSAAIYPHSGYPFTLDTQVRHELGEHGLTVTHTITNAGAQRAPVAVGAHPYLKIGDVDTAELTVTVNADTHFEVDDRLNLTGEHPVDGTRYDLRSGAVVGDLELDDGWADATIRGGRAEHSVRADDGREVVLWGDDNFGYVQVFTTRALASLPTGQVAIAIEPMSAPANALNTGRGLHWLEPGETWTASWGIAPRNFVA